MNGVEIASSILGLLAGIGTFLVACSMLSSNLEVASASKLRDLFAHASKSKLLGVGIGTLTAAAIQSSGATTVIVIGFLNAGIMSLVQAATVIFGANIGTTVTGQIVAWGMSGGSSLSTTVIFSGLAGIGAFITTFGKSDKLKTVGGILTGFGLLFVGLELMGSSMESFANYDSVRVFLASIKNPFLLVAIGAILTAIIESSSVMTSVAIAMIVTGLITFSQGVYITMGSNIGACIVSLLASLSGTVNARRAPVINLTFNIGGAVIFLVIDILLGMFTGGSIGIGTPFEAMFPSAPQIQLAMFHTAYNIGKVIIALPLTEAIVAFSKHVVPDTVTPTEKEASQLRTYYISEAIITTPAIAVQQTKNEIINMADIAMRNAVVALECARTLDLSGLEVFDHNEEELNYLNRELARYIARLFGEQLSEEDRDYLSHALHSISDLERVGDYAKNITEYAGRLVEEEATFSGDAQDEIAILEDFIDKLFSSVMHCYVHNDVAALDQAKAAEAAVDLITDQMTANHVERMANGSCTPEVGAHYIALVNDSERIGDHFYNLAKTVRGL